MLYRVPAINLTAYPSVEFWPDTQLVADLPEPCEYMDAFFAWMDEVNAEAVRRAFLTGLYPKKPHTASIAGLTIQ